MLWLIRYELTAWHNITWKNDPTIPLTERLITEIWNVDKCFTDSLKNVSTETVFDPVRSALFFWCRGEQCDEDCPLRKVRGRICVSCRGLVLCVGLWACLLMPWVWPPSLCFLSHPCLLRHLSSSFLFFFCCNKRTNWEKEGRGVSLSLSPWQWPPVAVKAISLGTHIQGDPVPACPALNRAVVSHQRNQRATAGSEKTLTRRGPSGWQAIAHPQLTADSLHLTPSSAAGQNFSIDWDESNMSAKGEKQALLTFLNLCFEWTFKYCS